MYMLPTYTLKKFVKLLVATVLTMSIIIIGYSPGTAAAFVAQSDTSSIPADGTLLSWPPNDIRILHQSSSSSPAVSIRLTSSKGTDLYIRPTQDVVSGIQYINVPILPDDSYVLSYIHDGSEVTQSFTIQSVPQAAPDMTVEESIDAATRNGRLYLIVVGIMASIMFGVFYVVRFKKLSKSGKIAYPASFVALLGIVSFVSPLSRADTTSQDEARCLLLSAFARNECLAEIGLTIATDEGIGPVMVFLESIDKDPRFVSANGEHICHEFAHKLGQKVLVATMDINKSLEGSTMACELGFIHGVAEAAARYIPTDAFYEYLAELCTNIKTSETGDCSHGVGHSISIRNNVSMVESAAMCDTYFIDPALADTCIEAVSMGAAEWLGNKISRTKSYTSAVPHNSPSADMLTWCSFLSARLESNKKCMTGLALLYKASKDALAYLPEEYRTPQSFMASCLRLEMLVDNCLSAAGQAVVAYSPDSPESYSALCDSIASKAGIEACYEGVIVQAVVTVHNTSNTESYIKSICTSSTNLPICLKASANYFR